MEKHYWVDIVVGRQHRRAEPLPGREFWDYWFENEPNHENMIWIGEHIDDGRILKGDKPYCCYTSTVIFNRRGEDGLFFKVAEYEGKISQGGFSPKLIWRNGYWWEVGSGKVEWGIGGWKYKHRLHRNTRTAVAWSGDMWIDDLATAEKISWGLCKKIRNICAFLREWRILPGKPKKGQEIQWAVI